MKRVLVLAVLIACGVGAWLWLRPAGSPDIFRFEAVAGPDAETPVPPPVAARIEDFGGGGPNRIGVLVTDRSADWLGLVRGFKAHGIPFALTTDPARVVQHQMVIAYPSISGRVLDKAGIQALAAHVRAGGTLLTFDLAGGGLEELFGISGQVAGRARSEIRWTGAASPEDGATLINSARAEARVGSLGITATTATVLARYDDGAPAATCRAVGGHACILGVDLGSLTQRAMNGRADMVSPDFVNTYRPGVDVLFRWVRDLYVRGEDTPFLIGTAPAGREGSLILTHDVDFTKSVRNAVLYADAIRTRGVSATFLIQTKYVKDWNDDIFFNSANLAPLRRIAPGMEIGSHSVAHARAFRNFALGTGRERYPDYRPFVKSRTEADGGTVLGELRVSKYLLETLVGGSVRSFRPGHLSYPNDLPQAMAATGYAYSSTLTANGAMTHLPFRTTYARSGEALVPVWEFPVTIEDEKSPALGERFDAAVAVIDRIAAHGGVAVVLIHPNEAGGKLAFEERLIDRMKGRLWIGSLGDFGDWWRARDLAEYDFADEVVTVAAREPLNDVTIVFPKQPGRQLVLQNVRGRRSFTVP